MFEDKDFSFKDDLQFWKPKDNEARSIRILEPRPEPFHTMHYHSPEVSEERHVLFCTGFHKDGLNNCPICQALQPRRKRFSVRFSIFVLKVIDAFKRLIRRK